MTREELIKERRAEPWRADLRKATPNKERITAPRTPMPTLGLEERLSAFHHEVALGYTTELAMEEARRCLDCPSPGCGLYPVAMPQELRPSTKASGRSLMNCFILVA